MQVHFGTGLLHPEWKQAVVCVGTFDGVHLGHQAVLSAAVRRAKELECPSVLVTFDRHPAHVLAPDRVPPAVASLDENLNQMNQVGINAAVILEFNRHLSETSAQQFFDEVLVQKIRATEAVVGYDFAFGKGREGTAAWLSERIPTTVVPAFEIDEHRASSTEVRQLISDGKMEAAARLLGRSWSISGVVVSGEKLGRTLGFPTINIARSSETVTPPHGIYAGKCETPFGTYKAAINIGTRPTFDGAHRTIEAFLLDYPGEPLYSADVRLSIYSKLREEMKFDSPETLIQQMVLDVEETNLRVK